MVLSIVGCFPCKRLIISRNVITLGLIAVFRGVKDELFITMFAFFNLRIYKWPKTENGKKIN